MAVSMGVRWDQNIWRIPLEELRAATAKISRVADYDSVDQTWSFLREKTTGILYTFVSSQRLRSYASYPLGFDK